MSTLPQHEQANGGDKCSACASSSYRDRKPTSSDELNEILFGRSVFPLDAFAYGRSVGHCIQWLYPNKIVHVLRGIRAGINEIRERGEVKE